MTKRIEGIKEIAAKYSTFFFDLDGVVVIGWLFSGKVRRRSREASRLSTSSGNTKNAYSSSPTAVSGTNKWLRIASPPLASKPSSMRYLRWHSDLPQRLHHPAIHQLKVPSTQETSSDRRKITSRIDQKRWKRGRSYQHLGHR